MANNQVYSINGPVVTVLNTSDFSMLEMVYVGHKRLIGEVIATADDRTTIQVYENTAGLGPGEPVEPSGAPVSVLLGPGILRGIYDGIQRPLRDVAAASGAFIAQGAEAPPLDENREWDVSVLVREGDTLKPGQKYASCPETPMITHYCLVPPNLSGKVVWAAENGEYRIHDAVARIEDANGKIHELTLCQKWPIKTPRPVSKRKPLRLPLITGQRVIDTLFPIAKGGAAAVPGGFGTGKTMTQHQLAKWCDADIIIYIGCGERGNEMTQVLEEFQDLIDPKSGSKLTDRTVLIANTSNMPVAAREASIYTGVTLAEYYRDMGYHVAIMADSTSRWAEALREISGRLEEMPAEEGFPAYLPSRLSEFYERAGYMTSLAGDDCSVSIIGAVSPQGSDFSEPVTQNTRRFVRAFWALDKSLAYARHYPSINWDLSYSEYIDDLADWFYENAGKDFSRCRQGIATILQQERELMEIVKLIGEDVLPDDQRLTLEIAKVIRVGYLQQNAFHKDDTYVPPEKQMKMMQVILHLNEKCRELVAKSVPLSRVSESGLFDRVTRIKYDVSNDNLGVMDDYFTDIDGTIEQIAKEAVV